MLLYPTLRASELVGTDLVQAVPLVASAALGHVIFGDLQLKVTAALLVGSVPGAFIGAQLSSRLPGALIRRALAFVLLASALKLLGAGNDGHRRRARRRSWCPPGRSGWCCGARTASPPCRGVSVLPRPGIPTPSERNGADEQHRVVAQDAANEADRAGQQRPAGR